MTVQFRLPDVGEGLTEADIVSWKVGVGDVVVVNQIIVEIETAKSLVELPSPIAGHVASLLVAEGDTVEVGTPIIDFSTEESEAPRTGPEGGAATASPPPPTDTSAAAESSGNTLVGYGVKEEAGRRRRLGRRSQSQAASEIDLTVSRAPAQPSVEADGHPGSIGAAAVRARAKPPVRKRAKDAGVDLTDVPATGPNGDVTRKDLEQYLNNRVVDAPVASPTADGRSGDSTADNALQVIPLKGVRKATANAMVASAFTAPHITVFLDVDVTQMVRFVAAERARAVEGEAPPTPLAVLARAVCWAVGRTPSMNATLDGDVIRVPRGVNLGIAAATDRGLIVPNIKDAHVQSVGDLARSIRELATTARSGRTSPDAQRGGTLTITNIGVFGVDSGTPILNPGETAIVGFGQIRERPWVVDGELAVRSVTTLSVSADHRVVDGAEVSTFIADIGRALENPATMLL